MIRLRVLGTPDLRGDDATELRSVLTQPRLLGLFAYLALARPRGFHRRDSLVALFWPELNNEGARNALRQTVHRLRGVLGEGVVVNRGADELGLVAGRLWCDAVAFEDTLEAGDPLGALEQYRGDLLPGFFLSEAPEFERWLDEERARLRQRAATAAWDLAERAAVSANAATTAHWARWAAALTPDDEGALRRQLGLLVRVGDRPGAQRAYDAFARRLAEDYQSEPSAETRAILSKAPVPPTLAAAFGESAPAPAVTQATASSGTDAAKPQAVPPPAMREAEPATRMTHARRGRWLVPAAAGAALALAAVLAWPRASTPARPGTAEALAVFPFSVRGDPELNYLAEGMVDLLSAKLEGVAGLRSIDPRATIAATRGDTPAPAPHRASTVAAGLGARWFVLGDVVEIAGRVTLSAVLYRAAEPSRPVVSRSVEGDAARLAELVDELAGQLLAGQVPTRDTAITRVAALTTQSLPALKAFLAGEQALRAGREAQAVAAFLDAVTLDTSFALARYRLAVTMTWAPPNDLLEMDVEAERAARSGARLTPLARDLLAAYRAYRLAQTDDAERLYRQVTTSHPDNVEAWLMLGETWFHFNGYRGRLAAEAKAAFERVLALDPANPHAMIHLARLAALEGERDQLDTLARRFRSLHSDAERVLEMRALYAFATGDTAETERVFAAGLTQSEPVLDAVLEAALHYAQAWDAVLVLSQARLRGREAGWLKQWGRFMTELPTARGAWAGDPSPEPGGLPVDHEWLLETQALLAADPLFPLERSRVAGIRDSVERRTPYRPQTYFGGTPNAAVGSAYRTYLLGLLSARLGELAGAAARQRELATLTDTVAGPVAALLAHGVAAEIARTRGDLIGALREAEYVTVGLLWKDRLLARFGTRERFLRAELLHALGRDDEALPWYASFWGYYDLLYIAPAHLRQGEIYEKKGNVERALFHYARFINMWKDCDPEFRPLVIRAEQAFARLKQAS